MDQEFCPQCESDKTDLVEIEGEKWWRCRYQGCAGRISGDWYHWRPGQGLKEKPQKGKKAADDDEADES